MKTVMARTGAVEQGWHLVDADGKVLGRLASHVARILMGKHRPLYTPHVDTGEYVVVVNAEKVRVTGNKERRKLYFRSTGRPGGMKIRTLREVREQKPEDLVRLAVKRMLPKTTMGKWMFKKLKVYRGGEHPHAAQQPRPLDVRA
jgi:large subunit ribosomal protein L13